MAYQILKDTLRERGISQRELARRIGYTESYVNQAINGHIPWNKRAITLLTIALDLSPEEVDSIFDVRALQKVRVSREVAQ